MISDAAIKSVGLNIIQRREMLESDFLIEADYEEYDSLISKYFIYTIGLQNFEMISKNEDSYHDFELNYIEPIFMDINGDLSWNLYLVFVLLQEDYKQLSSENKSMVERGAEYARKLVISETQFSQFVPVGRLENADPKIVFDEPIQDWIHTLSGSQMGFCLEKFSTKKFDAFLSADVKKNVEKYTDVFQQFVSQTNGNTIPVTANELHLGTNFRTYCFSPNAKFSFSKVNLFEGANGSGKTSVLEAIELAFTGDTQRNRMGKSRTTERIASLTLSTGESFTSAVSAAERKKRESRFYQNHEKIVDKLNPGFHQYNYFSSEEVFNFCFNEQPDFNDAFSRVIFGEDVSSIESRWLTYREKFLIKKKGLNTEMDKVQAQLDLLGEYFENGNENITVATEIVRGLLEKINIAHENPAIDNLQILVRWSKEIQAKLVGLQNSTSYLTRLNEMEILNVADLKQRITQINFDQQNLKFQEGAIVAALKGFEQESLRVANSLQASREGQKNIIDELNKTKQLMEKYNQFIHIYSNSPKIAEREGLEKQRNMLINRLRATDALLKNWGTFLKQDFPSRSKPSLVLKKKTYSTQMADIENELRSIGERENSVKGKNELLKNIICEIKSLGRQYLRENPDARNCPLCGTKHIPPGRLNAKIQIALEDEDNELQNLLEEASKLNNCLAVKKIEFKRIADDLEKYRVLDSAKQYLSDNQKELGITLTVNATYRETYNALQLFIDEKPMIISALKKNSEDIVLLESEGFTLERINQANLFFASDEIKKVLLGKSLQNGKKAIDKVLSELENRQSGFRETEHEYQSKLVEFKADIKKLEHKRKELMTDSQKNKNQIAQLDQWIGLIQKNIELGYKSLERMTFQDWLMLINKAIEGNSLLQQRINEKNIQQEKNRKLVALKQELVMLKATSRRCHLALKTLDQLNPLSKLSEEFLNRNIHVISELFQVLHLPREFEALKISDNQLVASRRGAEYCQPIHQMSAGQRTAVVLAVFFALHLSMRTAPNFILLDEPVANMDDLNVLGLLDFLRQLNLTRGTQIFFTTANPLVASLFRRKFSYLNNEFSNYRFKRIAEKPSRISRIQYTTNEEEGRIIRMIP